jgi:hypothetical protein
MGQSPGKSCYDIHHRLHRRKQIPNSTDHVEGIPVSELFLAIITTAILAQADATAAASSTNPHDQQRKWNEYYSDQATKYEIRKTDDADKLLELKPNPVLFWSNPVRIGETNGAVYIWTDEGRAAAVGTIFSFLDRRDRNLRIIAHSFHSLSTGPLVAERDGRKSWSIDSGGIQPQTIPGGPEPANGSPQRLLQMRELAREFAATTVQDGIDRELRLLPQPIYRNELANERSKDGALFTFVTGTDPELMLLIDVRESSIGPRWHYAAARFTDLTVRLSHKQTEVWSYERQSGTEDGKSPYVSGRVASRSSVID